MIDDGSTAAGGLSGGDPEGNRDDVVGGSASSTSEVDEDAVVRCLNFSVDAHVRGGEVAAFEPIPPKIKEATAAMKDSPSEKISVDQRNNKEGTKSKKGKWFPASLPLPSWAKDIP
eukprot:CAMPEP_0172538328 /NCGR_PEP_ID=MMETSP1067-20121228/9732_1 /TAXON_ID=265564 ORGANISM="Thalassiosira punctigera, Strain Tpunct2005C2" /NCGR_SAMPLE_ID=MMETSP1067 /ASSEMBLY_ACC=CAM_ASM_000444 /LENGTH=115 /DNA_ID=CAMNT_0013323803 /DNA_START=30 /DNA_END=377 /DNA_ORIENTATION=-